MRNLKKFLASMFVMTLVLVSADGFAQDIVQHRKADVKQTTKATTAYHLKNVNSLNVGTSKKAALKLQQFKADTGAKSTAKKQDAQKKKAQNVSKTQQKDFATQLKKEQQQLETQLKAEGKSNQEIREILNAKHDELKTKVDGM